MRVPCKNNPKKIDTITSNTKTCGTPMYCPLTSKFRRSFDLIEKGWWCINCQAHAR